MTDRGALVEKAADDMITPPSPPPDEGQGHRMIWRSMGGTTLVVDTMGLGLQVPPWVNTWFPPHEDHTTSPTHSPVLLTPGDAGGFMEMIATHGHRMMPRAAAVPPPFATIPPAMATSFPQEFGYSNLEHDATAPPDDMMGRNLTPCSLQALLNNFDSYFWLVLVGIFLEFTVRYQRKTRSVIRYCKFGGNPLFTQKGGIGPLFDAS
jgi:hypothetical protein